MRMRTECYVRLLLYRSQGKPKIVPKIEGINALCLSGCSSITELARAMGLALFERAIVPVASHPFVGVTPPLVLEL